MKPFASMGLFPQRTMGTGALSEEDMVGERAGVSPVARAGGEPELAGGGVDEGWLEACWPRNLDRAVMLDDKMPWW